MGVSVFTLSRNSSRKDATKTKKEHGSEDGSRPCHPGDGVFCRRVPVALQGHQYGERHRAPVQRAEGKALFKPCVGGILRGEGAEKSDTWLFAVKRTQAASGPSYRTIQL